MDEETCMPSVARYFLNFLKDESCGKCTPCREGIAQMLDILTRITKGKGREGDVQMLETLGEEKAGAKIEDSVKFVTANKLKSMQAGKMGYSTSEVGDLVAEKVCN